MKLSKEFRLVGSFSLFVFLVSLAMVNSSMAQLRDEFDAPTLNEALWEMRNVAGASFDISNGILTMTSPAVESGSMLYYPVNVEDIDISFEVRLDTAGLVDNITVGFIAGLIDPQVNTEINNHWEANFFIVPANWYLKQDPVNIGEKPPNPGIEGPYDAGWNVVKVENSESNGKITFFLNGEEIGVVDKNPDVEQRYFYITCDPYTSHYSGAVAIDYIEIEGEGIAAVEPVGKVATSWGRLKGSY
jgi:hypothetical protein